jgi:transcriptional regulator with XRE-family HTH domain
VTEIGQILKEAREAKKLTLDDIHKKTKIQKRYLLAIEEGNLDALPGQFYSRAFVKSYAESVDVDVDYVLDQIKPLITPEEQIKNVRRTRQQMRMPNQAGNWLTRVLLYLFAVLILSVIYFGVTDFNDTPSPTQEPGELPSVTQPIGEGVGQSPTNSPATGGNQKVSPPAPEQPKPQAKPQLRFIGQENNVYQYEIAEVNTLELSIAARGKCWMRLLQGGPNGKKVDELTLNPTDEKQWTTSDTGFWLRLGSAPDVDIKVNGQVLDTSQMKRAVQIISIKIAKP